MKKNQKVKELHKIVKWKAENVKQLNKSLNSKVKRLNGWTKIIKWIIKKK